VGGCVASAPLPLGSGVGSYGTEDPFRKILCPGATLTLVDDRMAPAAVEIAPFSGHERTLDATLQSCALHVLSSSVLLEAQ
jgi:hypothetical protein